MNPRLTAEEDAAYRRGLSEMRDLCIEACHQAIRTWLNENKDEPEEDRVGYPPFHMLKLADTIRQL